MDGELEQGGRRLSPFDKPSKPITYTEIFDEAFPEYLAMGMTYDLYWNMDAALVKAYRKAKEIRRDEHNFDLWLQGRYIYDAIAALSPILRTSFSKRPVKAEKYVEKPYPLTEKAAQKAIEDEHKARMMAALERFKQEAEANKLKKQMQEKEASVNNG